MGVGVELGQCGKLNIWLSGVRKAASASEDFFFAEVIEQADFRRGAWCLVIFRHEGKDFVGAVHGDDFVFGGSDEDLEEKVLAAKFLIKMRAILGPEMSTRKMKYCLRDQ